MLSCSSNEDTPVDPNVLPTDENPVEFAAVMEEFRTDGGLIQTELANNDKVVIRHTVVTSSNLTPSDAHVATYTFSSGKLTTSSPAYWSRKDEVRRADAWKLGDGSLPTILPTYISVDTDQSDGIDNSDFLYATGEFTFGGDEKLRFTHQMSKVSYRIKLEGSASIYTSVAEVRLGNSDLASGADFTPTVDEGGFGTWLPVTFDASIKPCASEPTAGYAACGSAIMIPQSLGGREFINITLSTGKCLTWHAPDDEILEAGKAYTYEATVTSDLSAVSVRLIEGATWTEGENVNVGSTYEQHDYGPIKIGDYYYNDGSWSDGGFIRYDNSGTGSVVWTSPKPAPTYENPVTGKSRYVIGLVFSTDQSRIGASEKSALAAKGIEPHGLVLCVRTILSSQWDNSANDETAIGINNVAGSATDPLYDHVINEISGKEICDKILANRADQIANGNYLAVKDVTSLEAPLSSTGWFVPAVGQWIDMLRNLTGMDFSDKPDFYFTSNQFDVADGLHFDWQLDMTVNMIEKYKNVSFLDLLNLPLSGMTATEKDDFNINENFITCTLADAGNMYYTNVLPKFITIRRASKHYRMDVRPMLAF